MKTKQLITLVIAAVIVVIAGVMVSSSRQQAWDSSGAKGGGSVFAELPVNDVTAIEIIDGDTALKIAKKDGKWRVPGRFDYPANFSNISEFLRDLADLKAAQSVAVGPSQYGRLALLKPGEGDDAGATGTLVNLYGDSDKKIAAVLLGKEHQRKSEDGGGGPMGMMGGGSWPDGRYIMVPETKKVVLVSETFSAIKPQAQDWLDKEFFKIGDIKTASLQEDGNEVWRVSRDTKAGEMTLAGLAEGEEQDDSKVRSIKNAFSWASFQDVADPALAAEESGMDKPKVFSAEDFDGFSYTVTIGKKDASGKYYLSAQVSFDGPKERTPAEDEKPEDKEKNDAEFKKTLEENEKKAQEYKERLAGWVYLVSSSTVDSVLKERKDLIKEKKKEEAKKSAAPAATDAAAASEAPTPTPTPPPPPPVPADTVEKK